MSIEVRSEEEITKMGTEYAIRILNIQKQIAEFGSDIKEIKKEARLDGVPIGLVTKSLNKIKAELKKSEGEIFEEDAWYELFKDDKEIIDKIAEINNI